MRLPVDVAQQLRAGSGPNAQFAAAELAATAALEWRECADTTRAECARRIVALLSEDAALNNLRPVVRARAGDRLSQLGDLRFDPKRFWLPADEMLGFVRIAADPSSESEHARRMGSGWRRASAVRFPIGRSVKH